LLTRKYRRSHWIRWPLNTNRWGPKCLLEENPSANFGQIEFSKWKKRFDRLKTFPRLGSEQSTVIKVINLMIDCLIVSESTLIGPTLSQELQFFVPSEGHHVSCGRLTWGLRISSSATFLKIAHITSSNDCKYVNQVYWIHHGRGYGLGKEWVQIVHCKMGKSKSGKSCQSIIKLLRYVLKLCLLLFFIYSLAKFVAKFAQKPTGIQVEEKVVEQFRFPSVVFCAFLRRDLVDIYPFNGSLIMEGSQQLQTKYVDK